MRLAQSRATLGCAFFKGKKIALMTLNLVYRVVVLSTFLLRLRYKLDKSKVNKIMPKWKKSTLWVRKHRAIAGLPYAHEVNESK